MWTNLAFAAFLIVVSGLLLATDRWAWQKFQSEEHDERAHDFQRRRYRRRMQASAMIGAVGLTIAAGSWLEDSVLSMIYWSAVLLVVIWIAVLAIADLLASRFYFKQIRDQQVAEHAALQAEVDRLRRRGSNGRPEQEPPNPVS